VVFSNLHDSVIPGVVSWGQEGPGSFLVDSWVLTEGSQLSRWHRQESVKLTGFSKGLQTFGSERWGKIFICEKEKVFCFFFNFHMSDYQILLPVHLLICIKI